MQLPKYKIWLTCISFLCFFCRLTFAQSCPPSPESRPDIYRFIIEQDNFDEIEALEELFSSQFARVIQDKSFSIDKFDGLIDIFIEDQELINYHRFISIWFALQFTSRIIEEFNINNDQEILEKYINMLLSEDGIGIDFIASALPLLENYWSDEYIKSMAFKAYQARQSILDRYDNSKNVLYPLPNHISKQQKLQLRICEISSLKSALEILEILKE